MIGKCRFDSHSLRQPPDFVREPTIMDYFVLDSALWPRRLRGRNNAGCPPNCGSGPKCNHAISTAGYSWYEGPLVARSGPSHTGRLSSCELCGMLVVAGRSGRRIDDELEIRIVIGLKTCMR